MNDIHPDEHDDLVQLLDAAAAAEAEALAAVRRASGDPGDGARAAEALADLWRDEAACAAPPPPPAVPKARRRARLLVPLAAAALLALSLWLAGGRDGVPGPGEGVRLGGPAVELLEPRAGFDRLESVRWRAPPGAEGWTYVVRILGGAPGEPLTELLASGRLVDTVFLPPPAAQAAWPQDLVVEVQVWDASGQPLAPVSVSSAGSPAR